jgi:MFS family permease
MTVRATAADLPAFRDRRLGRIVLVTALSATNIGDGIGAVAFPLLALERTRSPVAISMVTVVVLAPRIVGQIPAGLLIARFGQRRAIVAATASQSIVYAGAAALTATDWMGYPHILACALLSSLTGVTYDLAAITTVPSLVAPEDLTGFTATLVFAENLSSSFVGAPLGGLAVAVAIGSALGATSFIYVATACGFALVFARRPTTLTATPGTHRRTHDLSEVWAWFCNQQSLRHLAVLDGIIAAAAAAVSALLVLFAQEQLSVGPATFGIWSSGLAVGAMAAAAAVRFHEAEHRPRQIAVRPSVRLRVGGFGLAFAFVTLGFASSVLSGWIVLVVVGGFLTVWQTSSTAVQLRLIALDARPRLLAIRATFVTSCALCGAIGAGGLAEHVGVPAAFVFAGLVATVAATAVSNAVDHLPDDYVSMPLAQ